MLATIHMSIKPIHKRTTSITWKVNRGAKVNVISKTDYNKISANPKEKIVGPLQVLTAHGGQTINCIGMCEVYIHHNNTTKPATFAVNNLQGPTMLVYATCQELNLTTINCGTEKEPTNTEMAGSKRDNARLPKEPQVYQPLTKDKVVSDYKDRFEGQETSKMTPKA